MSAPLILGGVLMEIAKSLHQTAAEKSAEIPWPLTILGAVVAAVVGYVSLFVLLRALKGRWFWLFGVYCIAAGLLTVVLA